MIGDYGEGSWTSQASPSEPSALWHVCQAGIDSD